MSKSIIGIALLVVAVVAPYIGLPLLAVAAIEVGVVLANTLLTGGAPKGNLTSTAASRLYATLVTTEPRKWMLGVTAGSCEVRFL